jgi:hypothetical protein
VKDVDVAAEGAEQGGGDFGEFDGGPLDPLDLAARFEGEAAARSEGADEAADPGAGLEGADDAVAAGELGEEGTQDLGERVGDDGGGVILVDEAEGLGDEIGGELILDLVDAEAAPAGVAGEDLEIPRESSRLALWP